MSSCSVYNFFYFHFLSLPFSCRFFRDSCILIYLLAAFHSVYISFVEELFLLCMMVFLVVWVIDLSLIFFSMISSCSVFFLLQLLPLFFPHTSYTSVWLFSCPAHFWPFSVCPEKLHFQSLSLQSRFSGIPRPHFNIISILHPCQLFLIRLQCISYTGHEIIWIWMGMSSK